MAPLPAADDAHGPAFHAAAPAVRTPGVRLTPAPRGRLRSTRPLCLASASPRRQELLAVYGLHCRVVPAHVDESPRPGEAPAEHVLRLARAKARDVAARVEGLGILSGDTIVEVDGVLLGKPADAADVARMLRRLAGRTHRVITAYALLDPRTGACGGRSVVTNVTFRALPAEWIAWYAALSEPLDKAGAYAVQGVGGAMIERIDGSYTNVVGFPIEHIVWDMLASGWVELC